MISVTARNAGDRNTPGGILENSRYHDKSIYSNISVLPFTNHEAEINFQSYYATDVGIPGGSPFTLNSTARYPQEKRELINGIYRIQNFLILYILKLYSVPLHF